MLYPINEIFYSIQGEGRFTGTPAVFIRFAECNLNCSFCDTDFSKKEELSLEAIISRVLDETPSNWAAPLFVLTGGEPTLFDIEPIAKELKDKFTVCTVAVETNGTLLHKRIKNSWHIDWLTVSPKLKEEYTKEPSFWAECFEQANEIKIVMEDFALCEVMLKGFLNSSIIRQPLIYIQPCSEDYKPAIDFVLNFPNCRLSIQTQKIIGVR